MATVPIGRPFEVMLVEDNPGDVRIVQESLKESDYSVNLTVATDGVEALEILRDRSEYRSEYRPHLILLDLNLPRMSGGDFLAEVKSDFDLRRIPVVVLTSSQEESDVLEVYDLQANAFVSKPAVADRFDTTLAAVQAYWIGTAKVPRT